MAEGFRFACDRCDRELIAWSDGNPYFLDERGRKQYAYHPDHDNLERCIGNDTPHLCLDCGTELMIDSRDPRDTCPGCGSRIISDCLDLDGKPCPGCKSGRLRRDPDWFAVS